MKRLLDRKNAEKQNKTSKFESLPDSTQTLITNTSSPDGEYVPATTPDTCVAFFKKKDGARAKDLLEETLGLKFGCVVSVDRGRPWHSSWELLSATWTTSQAISRSF